jgi:hypothetical protein
MEFSPCICNDELYNPEFTSRNKKVNGDRSMQPFGFISP